ncbi:beta-glucosidase 11-like isoform X2 [Arachis stenosperma]|uniref:beta-glucosidase 11-like isoform X2 n=1 Tax=Arachis stenosperma TaxID=217475 RepID=UPI0025AD4D45|nr:beta-glucosidase 11-like isoform X2 [Arachis stenosperma]
MKDKVELLLLCAEVLVALLVLPSCVYTLSKDEFPTEFVFGASTSAYQVEGAANEDGRKPSIWDTFAHSDNGNLYDGDGDITCDQYHKYKEDVQLMANMGLDAYRLSISWSRLIPDGRGEINPKGLQYYNNLINELISHGIQPHVTLHHWDLPQKLEDEYGGWVSRRIVKDFTEYADVCFREFGDRGMQNGFVGFNILTVGLAPQTNSSEDITATQRVQDFYHGWYLHPFIFGDYPETMKKIVRSRLPSFTKKESNLVKDSMDFLGINFYYSFLVKNNVQMDHRDYMADMAADLIFPDGTPFEEVPITPWSLQGVLDSFKNTYGNFPLYIHENGQQTPRNSSLDDWPRVKYLQEYIGCMLDSVRSGLNVKGYFVWSFLDAFELLSGYEFSYGLYFVDLKDPSLSRQPKLSAKWYSDFLKTRPMDPNVTMQIQKNNSPMLDSL